MQIIQVESSRGMGTFIGKLTRYHHHHTKIIGGTKPKMSALIKGETWQQLELETAQAQGAYSTT